MTAKSGPSAPARSGSQLAFVGVGVLALVVLLPLLALAVESFRPASGFGIDAWQSLYSNPGTFDTIRNTLTLAGARTAIAFVLGAGIAWLLARTTLPERRWLELGFWASLFMPTLTVTLGWALLFDGERGLGQMLPVGGLFDVFSWWGIVFTHLTSGTLAFAVVLLVPVFRGMDASVEDASDALGGGRLHKIAHITLPAMLPALAAVTALSLLRSIDTLEVEWVLGAREGIDVLGTFIYADVLDGGTRFGGSAALSSLFLALAAPLALAHRWVGEPSTRSGSSVKPADLGRWASPAFYGVALVLSTLTIIPLAIVLLASLGPFTAGGWSASAWLALFKDDAVMSALQTSFAIAIGASFLSIALFSAMAYFATRAKPGIRQPLEALLHLPAAVPGVLVAMGLLVAMFQVPAIGDLLHGKVVVLVFVALLTALPVGVQVMRTALAELGADVEDASRAAGADLGYTLRHVLLPLIAPAMLLVGMLTFALAIRTTGPFAILATDEAVPLTVLQLDLVRAGADPLASVIGVLVSVMAVGVAVGARLISIGGVPSAEGSPKPPRAKPSRPAKSQPKRPTRRSFSFLSLRKKGAQ